MHYPRILLALALLLGHSLASAQQANRPADPGELYYQLQLLQQQVMELRGLVEEQGNQLRKLQQQRLDDYINLDRRVSELSGGKPATGSPAPASPVSYQPPAPVAPAAVVPAKAPATQLSENDAYSQALGQLKARQFDDSIQSFRALLATYPNGEMAPNAWYWLGELYLQNNQLDESRKHFQHVLDSYPGHAKVPDALYKLGRVYRLQGDGAKAKALLQQVISQYPGNNAAQLAQTELNTQF